MERWKPVMGQGFIFILKYGNKGCPGSLKAQKQREEGTTNTKYTNKLWEGLSEFQRAMTLGLEAQLNL